MRGGSGGGGHEDGPRRDSMDPGSQSGMPKIVGLLADRVGRGQPGSGSGSVATLLFVGSVLAIIIAFGVFFIVAH